MGMRFPFWSLAISAKWLRWGGYPAGNFAALVAAGPVAASDFMDKGVARWEIPKDQVSAARFHLASAAANSSRSDFDFAILSKRLLVMAGRIRAAW
jgi:hypothetical protein